VTTYWHTPEGLAQRIALFLVCLHCGHKPGTVAALLDHFADRHGQIVPAASGAVRP